MNGDLLPELKERLHQKLIGDLHLARLQSLPQSAAREAVSEATDTLLEEEGASLSLSQRQRLMQELADEVVGLGPLEPLLEDPTVSEIMVNAPDQVWVEREGRLYLSEQHFRDAGHIMQVVERVLAPLGRRLDESSPMVDARLPSGFRLNAIIPPLALRSPSVTIRKFFDSKYSLPDLVRSGSISEAAERLMRLCVTGRLNILVAGGTGSGKTTLLNALSEAIPADQRIVTIEDPAELRLKQPHVVGLETRPPNIEGRNRVTQRDLVINALRMRPDRIIVGEVRGSEAFDMLQAMNTGHDGSISTIHANGPRDALSRIENMVLMAGFELPVRAIREQVASALDLIIYLSRLRDGSRHITHITEVVGMEGEVITSQDLYLFRQTGTDGEGRIQGALVPTGIRPTFAERLAEMGLPLTADLFALPDDDGGSWR
ncbi:MAG: CpaF family protein [Chloroflexi bacterium]|nr:CpaF family protein [Chloroflexota bacterium]